MLVFLRRYALLFALLSAVAMRPAAAADGALVDQLMIHSGLNDQVANYQSVARASIEQQRGLSPAPQSEQRQSAEIEALVDAQVIELFEPTALLADVRAQLVANLDDASVRESLVWLQSVRGQRITAAEKAASTGEAYKRIFERGPELAANRENLDRVTELDLALGIVKFTTDITQNIQLASILSFAATQPGFDQQALESIFREVERSRDAIRQAVGPQVMLSLLFTYESLTDEDFAGYLDFVRSRAGERYHTETMEAVKNALTRAARSLGDRIMDSMKNRRAGLANGLSAG